VAVCAPRHREGPRWMGWLIPLDCVVAGGAPPGSGVISITPYLEKPLRAYLQSVSRPADCLPPEGKEIVPFMREYLPTGYPKFHVITYCTADSFLPSPEVFPIEDLAPDDLHVEWYRYHFDGPVFVARGPRGDIVSWVAVKVKSPDVWEMAVATDDAFRNRGLARSLVSRATRAALHAGKVPLYLYDTINVASGRVCRALGYQCYGYELLCEAGRIAPSHRPAGV
jgi:GNAT superfamily N-acetyltransferase